MSILIGTVAESATKAVAGSSTIEKALGRLGGHGSLVAAYLGLTFLLLALLIALIAAGQIVAIRSEEAEGRLENLVVRPLSRTAWFAGRLGLSTILLLTAGLLAGVGAWIGAASQHGGIALGSVLAAGINTVPPSVFLLGLGALVVGSWPRCTPAVAYGYLAWSFLLEFIGAAVHTNHWIMDTSVFFHMVPAPADQPGLGQRSRDNRTRCARCCSGRRAFQPTGCARRLTSAGPHGRLLTVDRYPAASCTRSSPPPLGNAADMRLEGAPLVRRLSARSLIDGIPSTG